MAADSTPRHDAEAKGKIFISYSRKEMAAMNLDKVGDVKLGTGDLPGALAAYGDALDVRREVAEPPQARAALTEALAILEKLEQQQKLTAGRKNWPDMVRTALSKLA